MRPVVGATGRIPLLSHLQCRRGRSSRRIGRRRFLTTSKQKFAGENCLGNERRRGSSRDSVRQKEERVAEARNLESLRWATQSPQKFVGKNSFGGERRRGSSRGRGLRSWKWRSEECVGDDEEPSPLNREKV
ncbi:hypothetical protein QYE76_022593 [Lolium multiflorum]|uniref:Uncharacterized protein n=1 Tax=Lolium multiflorum TaxID=4521 RepID=A0AAD8VTC1_LOLMU|nr:hypothetical protein QYE76_022593 [Lolium multiflorum]